VIRGGRDCFTAGNDGGSERSDGGVHRKAQARILALL